MRKIIVFVGIITALSLLVSSQSEAQTPMRWKECGNLSVQMNYRQMYNPQKVETIRGTVLSVDSMMSMGRMSQGLHLTLKTEDGKNMDVHLGPRWYIENQDIEIKSGDKIEVKGLRIDATGQPEIIAASVKKGNTVLTLRDESGFPVWRGWKRR